MTEKLKSFFDNDEERLSKLIEEHEFNIPIKALSEFLHVDAQSVRAYVEAGQFGMAWKKTGKDNHAYAIPTAQFVRWYTLKHN